MERVIIKFILLGGLGATLTRPMEGVFPWIVLVRNKIERGVPKKAKSWTNLPFCDLIIGNFLVMVQGSTVLDLFGRLGNMLGNSSLTRIFIVMINSMVKDQFGGIFT